MSQANSSRSCVILGAGMAGLMAARVLHTHGVRVVVIEKGRGVGGRMATRRIGGGVFDHGAQFITVRNKEFQECMSRWVADGIAVQWGNGFAPAEGDEESAGHPRYRGATGMTGIAKYLAREADVRLGERAVSVTRGEDFWDVRTESGVRYVAGSLILTAPVPQSLALIDAGDYVLPAETRASLETISYDPCLALLALLDGPSRIPEPGGLRFETGPVAWMADNRKKGISPAAWALTIHAAPLFSREQWEADDTTVTNALLAAAESWLGSGVLKVQLHRWRFSQPVQMHPQPCVIVEDAPPLGFSGDAFGGPRVEGAALSGLAVARRVLNILPS